MSVSGVPIVIDESIISCAQELFYARGFHAVGMDEICVAAGVSLKKLYKNFPSKDAVVLAVITRWHEQWSAALEQRIAAAPQPVGRLLAVYDFLAEWFETDNFRGCGFINAFGELGGISVTVADLTYRHKKSFQDCMDKLVEQAGAPAYLAAQLSILAEGAQTTAAIAGDSTAASQARDAAEVLIAAALRVATASASAKIGSSMEPDLPSL